MNESTLTCPKCGSKEKLTMPSDSCMIYHICRECNTEIRPLKGDCCVFCSYGDVRCPSKQ